MPTSPHHEITIELVESLEQLERYREQYDALIERAGNGRAFFYRLATMRAMAPVFAAGRSLFFLLAREGSELIAFVPLVLERKSITRAGVRRLSLWGGDGDVIGTEGEVVIARDTDRCIDAVVQALSGVLAPRFDVLDLRFVREDSPALAALRTRLPGARYFPEDVKAHTVGLEGGVEDYRASRSQGHMKKIGQLERKLAREHRVEWRFPRTLTADELQAVMRLHSARQRDLEGKGRPRTAVFDDAASRVALESLLELGAATGSARHTLLLADGQLIAFLLAFADGETLIAHITAVDTAFGGYRPGSLLHWAVIQSAFEGGTLRRIELGPGTTQIKDIFATSALRSQRVRWVAPGSLASRIRCTAWETLVRARTWYARRTRATPGVVATEGLPERNPASAHSD